MGIQANVIELALPVSTATARLVTGKLSHLGDGNAIKLAARAIFRQPPRRFQILRRYLQEVAKIFERLIRRVAADDDFADAPIGCGLNEIIYRFVGLGLLNVVKIKTAIEDRDNQSALQAKQFVNGSFPGFVGFVKVGVAGGEMGDGPNELYRIGGDC